MSRGTQLLPATVLATMLATMLATGSFVANAEAECGGGSSGDSGSSSSSSSGEGGYCESEPACVEVSPVVGYSECRRFGSWDAAHRPPLVFTIGSSAHRIAASSLTIDGVAEHPDMNGDASFRLSSEEDGGSFAGGSVDLRVALAIGRNAYAGVETQFGSLTTSALHGSAADMSLSVAPTSITYGAASAVAGVRLPIGAWDVRAELAAGAELFLVHAETRHDDCELTETAASAAWVLRPRALVERWVSPWITVGGGVGSNLLRSGDATATLFIGGHLRAFDGGR